MMTLVCFYKIFNTYHEQIGKRMRCVSMAIAQFIDKMFQLDLF